MYEESGKGDIFIGRYDMDLLMNEVDFVGRCFEWRCFEFVKD